LLLFLSFGTTEIRDRGTEYSHALRTACLIAELTDLAQENVFKTLGLTPAQADTILDLGRLLNSTGQMPCCRNFWRTTHKPDREQVDPIMQGKIEQKLPKLKVWEIERGGWPC
jgi:hypothetical protein